MASCSICQGNGVIIFVTDGADGPADDIPCMNCQGTGQVEDQPQ